MTLKTAMTFVSYVFYRNKRLIEAKPKPNKIKKLRSQGFTPIERCSVQN
jgi:hypothetical protein